MPTIVIRHPDGNEQAVDFTDELTIGRAEGNDVVLAEGGVSRKHVRFTASDDEVSVEDVGSANGTWVDGERIDAPTVVAEGQTITIGDYEAFVKPRPKKAGAKGGKGKSAPPPERKPTKVLPAQGRRASAPPRGKRDAPQEAEGPRLRGLTPPVEEQTFPIEGALIVGRVSSSDIWLDDDSVSRKHAEIALTGRGVVVRDLGSANGTSVNGDAIAEDVQLSVGDIVAFGDVELVFEGESADKPLAKRPSRGQVPSRAGARGAAPVRRGAASSEPDAGAPVNRKRLIIIASVVVGLLLIAGVAKALIGKPKPPPSGQTTTNGKPPPQKSDDEVLAEELEQCRDLVSRRQPEWDRAEAACDKVLEIDPINTEAQDLRERIKLGRKCEANMKTGQAAMKANRDEEALAAFEQIPRNCPYFGPVYELSRELVERVIRDSAKFCKSYFDLKNYEDSLRYCQLYARLKCQVMDESEWRPPPLTQLKLDGPLRKNDWRPKDPMILALFKDLQKLRPGETWLCPRLDIFRPPRVAEDPAVALKQKFFTWFSERGFGEAMGLYYDGKLDEAEAPLRKLKDNLKLGDELVRLAKEMSGDISAVKNEYRQGSTLLSQGKFEPAAQEFRDALALDQKLLSRDLGKMLSTDRAKELQRRESFVHKDIKRQMAAETTKVGSNYLATQSLLRACTVWKIGWEFAKDDPDLQQFLDNNCITKAAQLVKELPLEKRDCDQLKEVLDYTVDTNSFYVRARELQQEQHCH